jgi:hypothetical protein
LVTIFLSAFLLFQVQPLMGRYVLPWFGGTPAVWGVCLLFFQAMLLAGYGYAHWLGSLRSVRMQAVIHGSLLALSLLLLPVIPNEGWKPSGTEQPQFRILLLLLATVGGPYFLLSSTTPLLQRWFTMSREGAGWRLYALSNFGSFLALFSYPFLVEPYLRLRMQSWVWSAAYGVFVVVCGIVAWGSRNSEDRIQNSEHHAPAVSQLVFWAVLAATASALLLATTNLITQDVAVFPFLWILPLAVYLLSFILTFESDRWYWRVPYAVLCGVMALVATAATGAGALLPLWGETAIYLVTLFAVCMVCHGELARARPTKESLTAFYLTVSAGGVLGGIFVAMIAPNVFREYREYPLALAGACLLGLLSWRLTAAAGVARDQLLKLMFPVMALAFGALGTMLLAMMPPTGSAPIDVVRNFFGILWVSDRTDEAGKYRLLTHGRIRHGSQYQEEPLRSQATTYFGPRGGVGVVIDALQKERSSLRIAVIGLGAGTLAAWGRTGDTMRFYEINPDDERVARKWFSYLGDSKAAVDVALGDARIVMDREAQAGARNDYDMLIVDAFSSDAIPMHLLTAECAELYKKRLKPGGLLMIHISNRTLNLEPVVRGMADHLGFRAAHFLSSGYAPAGESASNWVLLTEDSEFTARTNLKRLESGWTDTAPLLWTDDFASLWHVLR